jgi:hypothetical protein|tara:strand:- start:282 stop:590 length:309 start_codon:yes stop_codon:yes gene_type:complete
MASNKDTTGIVPHAQWDALLRAPITGTECAFVDDPETKKERIVVIYNARNAPPVVTVDANGDNSVITLKADGAPIAVIACQSKKMPSIEDVMLIARHAPYPI